LKTGEPSQHSLKAISALNDKDIKNESIKQAAKKKNYKKYTIYNTEYLIYNTKTVKYGNLVFP